MSPDPTPLDPVRLEAAVRAYDANVASMHAGWERLPESMRDLSRKWMSAAIRAYLEAAAPAPVGEIETVAGFLYHLKGGKSWGYDYSDAERDARELLAALREPAGGP